MSAENTVQQQLFASVMAGQVKSAIGGHIHPEKKTFSGFPRFVCQECSQKMHAL